MWYLVTVMRLVVLHYSCLAMIDQDSHGYSQVVFRMHQLITVGVGLRGERLQWHPCLQ